MAAAQPAAKASASNNTFGPFSDEDDLFDAVLTGSVGQEKTFASQKKTQAKDDLESNPPDMSKTSRPPKRLRLYIGKFPWWITDEDIFQLAQTIGVKDMTEIKFAENKVNGLSRGYVEVVVTSEESMKLLLDKVPKCSLGGEKIFCRFANRHNLALFEDQANECSPLRAASNDMKESDFSFLSQNPFTSTMPQQFLNQFTNTFPPLPNPFLRFPAPPLPHMPPPPLLPFMFPNHPTPAPNQPPPSQNMNPAKAGTSRDGHSSSKSQNEERQADADFEDLINRNRAVASSAISKAVSGATTGDLRVAMETLLTAIAIIKQSKVYRDDRCQALVTSLKDCLVSIQGSYGYSRSSSVSGDERERDRERAREKSSSKEGRRTYRRHRDRSRSNERSKAHSKDRDRKRGQYY